MSWAILQLQGSGRLQGQTFGGKTWWNSCRADLGNRGKYFVWPQRFMIAASGHFLLMVALAAIIKAKCTCKWWTSEARLMVPLC